MTGWQRGRGHNSPPSTSGATNWKKLGNCSMSSLTISLTTHDSRNVSLVLVEFARLALAAHDPERAARLTAAADGLRARMRLRPWPMLRRGEDELRAQIREALGPERSEDAFAAGAKLSQRDAIAVARQLDRVDVRP